MQRGSIYLRDGELVKLDSADRTILQALISNSRTPLTTIAKKIRKSKSTTHYRISQLEKKDIILQYIAYYNLIDLGYPLYFLLLETDTKHQDTIIKKITSNTFVYAVLGLASPTNLLIATYAKSRYHIDELLGEWNSFDGVRNTSLFPVKFMEFVPYSLFANDKKTLLKKNTIKIDREDIKLLKELEYNSRTPLTEIALKINITAEALAARLKKLKNSRVILSFFTNVNIYQLGFQPYFILIKLQKRELLQKVFSFVVQHSNTNGQYHLDHDYSIATILVVPDILTFRKFIDGIKSIDSLTTIQSYLMTDQYSSNAFPEGIYRDLLSKY